MKAEPQGRNLSAVSGVTAHSSSGSALASVPQLEDDFATREKAECAPPILKLEASRIATSLHVACCGELIGSSSKQMLHLRPSPSVGAESATATNDSTTASEDGPAAANIDGPAAADERAAVPACDERPSRCTDLSSRGGRMANDIIAIATCR